MSQLTSKEFCCQFLRGEVAMRKCEVDSLGLNPNPYVDLGNVKEIKLTPEVKEIETENFQVLGGTDCYLAYPEKLNIEMTLTCMSPENLALVLGGQGERNNIPASTIVAEPHHIAGSEDSVHFLQIPDENGVVVVAGPGGAPVYVIDVDYKITSFGIEVIAGGAIDLAWQAQPIDPTSGKAQPLPLEITYDTLEQTIVCGLVGSGFEYEWVFKGTNHADNKLHKITVYRVRFTPGSEISVISDSDFNEVTISGRVLASSEAPNIKGGNIFSQYFNWQIL